MIENRIQITRLKKKIINYRRIILYGAGEMASYLLKRLNENDVKVESCVVTSKTDGMILCNGIEINRFSEYKEILRDEQTIIIIAVTSKYEKEIANILEYNGLRNYIFITEYLWRSLNEKTYNNIYKGQNYKWYRNRLNEWKQDYRNEINEYNVSLLENSIAVIAHNPSPRMCKILSALKKREGKVVVFIDVNVLNSECFQNFVVQMQKNSEAFICFYCIEELMVLLNRYKPKVIHIFSNPWNPYLAFELIRMKVDLGKIIFENYDIANGMYTIFSKEVLDMERFCMENADGVICRGFETEYLVKELGFKLKKVLIFFDYCRENIRTKEKDENNLSLCYAGGIITEKSNAGSAYACMLEMGRICEINKCHLHVYPPTWSEEFYGDYMELDKRSDFFHFHRPVCYEKLCEELSQYDFSVMPVKSSAGIVENSYITKEKITYAVSNKFFDSLEAGLPIIAWAPVKYSEMFEREGVLIRWHIEDFDFDRLRRCKDKYHEKIKRAQEKFSIDVRIDELLRFYNSL